MQNKGRQVSDNSAQILQGFHKSVISLFMLRKSTRGDVESGTIASRRPNSDSPRVGGGMERRAWGHELETHRVGS